MMANVLTALRLMLAAPVAWGIAIPGTLPTGGLLACVFIAIASDVLDGIVARKTGTASPRGRLFDHTTDFVFVTSGLAAAGLVGAAPPLLAGLIVVAFFQYVADSYWLHREKQLRMSVLGRWNGMLYFVPLVVLGLLEVVPGAVGLGEAMGWISWALIGSTVVSIADRGLAPRSGAGATFATAGAVGTGAETHREVGE